MVRAHLFLCLLAAHVQWHVEKKLAPLLFADEELEEQKAKSAEWKGRTRNADVVTYRNVLGPNYPR